MNQKEKEFCSNLFSLSSSPTIGELKKRYRELIKLYHPDTHPENVETSTRLVQRINEAYEILLANLHHIFSEHIPGQGTRNTAAPGVKDYRAVISLGDNALRDAVIIGWLKRTPKDDFAFHVRNTIVKALSLLNTTGVMDPALDTILFFSDLFSVFLQATAPGEPRPLPGVANATRFFHYYRRANKYLDSGIRNYYRFTENNKKITLPNIPLSFFHDAQQLYALLKRKISDDVLIGQIQAKMRLAELFTLRIKNPDVIRL